MVPSSVSVTKAASPRRRAAPPTLVITKGNNGCILQTRDASAQFLCNSSSPLLFSVPSSTSLHQYDLILHFSEYFLFLTMVYFSNGCWPYFPFLSVFALFWYFIRYFKCCCNEVGASNCIIFLLLYFIHLWDFILLYPNKILLNLKWCSDVCRILTTEYGIKLRSNC